MKHFCLTLLTAIILFCTPNAYAGKIMGGGLTWTQLGKDTYLVSFTFYKDCNDTQPLYHDIYAVSGCDKNYKILIALNAPTIKDITPVLAGKCTKCDSASCNFPYGILQFTYTGKVIFKTANEKKCCNWILKYKDCCRSTGLTNAPSGNAYIESKFNRCSNDDNSPYFSGPPITIFPTNQCVTYNIGAMDDDIDANGFRDSLVYSFAPPLDTSETPIIFNSPFSYDKPFSFKGFPNKDSAWSLNCAGFHLNSLTGEIQFTATKPEQTILKIRVDEYGRDYLGKPYLKGYVTREIQPIFMDFKNNMPELSGFNGGSNYDTAVCAGSQVCFNINTYDADIKDSVNVSMITNKSNTKLTVEKNKQHPLVTLCWTPSDSDAGDIVHQFILKATDNNSGAVLPGWTTRTYRIKVIARPKMNISVLTKNCGDVIFTATPAKGSYAKNYVWSGDDRVLGYSPNIKHHYRKPGSYKWQLTTSNSNNCIRIDSGIFIMAYTAPPYLKILGDSMLCGDTGLYFTSDTAGKPFNWTVNGGSINSGQGSGQIKVTWGAAGTGDIKLFQFNHLGCTDTAFLKVKTLPLPNASWKATSITPGTYNFRTMDTSLVNYSWNFGDSTPIRKSYKFSHTYTSNATFIARLTVTAANGCHNSSDSAIQVTTGILSRENTLEYLKISPNPFHEQTNITYSLSNPANVRIVLSDMQGKEIQIIANQNQNPGEYTQVMNAQKSGIAPGLYLLKVFVEGGLSTKEIIRLR